MYEITRFGDITLSLKNAAYTESPVAARQAFVETTAGTFDADGQRRNRPQYPHPIRYSCVVWGSTLAATRDELDALRGAVGTRSLLYRTARDDGSIHRCDARLVGMDVDTVTDNKRWREVTLNFQQFGPWEGGSHGSGWRFDDGEFFDSGRDFDEANDATTNITGDNHTFFVTNAGTIPVRNVVMTLTVGANPISQFRVVSPTSGMDLRWIGAMTNGQQLVIDTGAFSVEMQGSDAYSGFLLGPLHTLESWAELLPGSNQINVSAVGSASTAKFSIAYKDNWA